MRKPAENNWHYVDIKKMSNGSYKWKNNATWNGKIGVEWGLIPIPGTCNEFRVGRESPYYNSTTNPDIIAKFDQDGIFGPFDEYYSYECNFDRCPPFGDK